MSQSGVCFIGGARYSNPLDTTSEKKFRLLKALGELFVIGFSQDLRPRQFNEHAHFYLMPNLPIPLLRYVEVFVLGPFIVSWLIFRHGVQVLVSQSPYEGLAGAMAKKIAACFGRKVRLVVENHGDFEESLFMQRRILFPRLYRYIMRHVAGFTLKHADSLRAVSNSTREQLKRWVPGKSIFKFVAWTDIETFLETGIKRDRPFSQMVLYAGVLIPRKGIHHLISAFARIAQEFPHSRLIIAGSADNRSYAAQLRAQLKEADLNGRVEFVDNMPQEELARLMLEACLLVLPSYSEGLPRVIYEAMAAGLPVIASAVSGIPDVVQDGTTGFLVPPGDENRLAEQIRWMLAHPNDAYEMGHRGRAVAEQLFSSEAFVAAYHRVFEEQEPAQLNN
jgi:glycosyltransferase involved in cell wall biosynthesis